MTNFLDRDDRSRLLIITGAQHNNEETLDDLRFTCDDRGGGAKRRRGVLSVITYNIDDGSFVQNTCFSHLKSALHQLNLHNY